MKFNNKIKELMETMKVTPVTKKRTANSLKSKWKYAKDPEGNKVKYKKSEEEIQADREKLEKHNAELAKAKTSYKVKKRKAIGVDASKETEKLVKQAFIEDDDQKVIRTTYETWDEEDLEAGDTGKPGWEDEEGVVFDTTEEAINWLKDKGAEYASSSSFHPGIWYSTEESKDDTDYIEKGETTIYSFHLSGFTEEEEEEIFNAVI